MCISVSLLVRNIGKDAFSGIDEFMTYITIFTGLTVFLTFDILTSLLG